MYTQPINHQLCGGIERKVYYDHPSLSERLLVETNTSPISLAVDIDVTTLYIETIDQSLVGTQGEYEIVVTLEDYPSRTFSRTATITYIDPCIAPDFFSADPTELQLGPSFYNETTPYEVIAANYFTIEPSFCEITYTCTT